jgi:hypothetical protein
VQVKGKGRGKGKEKRKAKFNMDRRRIINCRGLGLEVPGVCDEQYGVPYGTPWGTASTP